jgi:hypothetical protein
MKNTLLHNSSEAKRGLMTVPFFMLLYFFVLVLAVSPHATIAQGLDDRTVAAVTFGESELRVTYSELIFEIAVSPNAPLEPPASADLKRVVQILVDQRVIALRIKANSTKICAPTENEVRNEIDRVLAAFPSISKLEERLRIAGYTSIRDEKFIRLITQRAYFQKYLDVAFRSRTVVNSAESTKYYREIYAPEFRRRYPGQLLPAFEEKRESIIDILTEQKVEINIRNFLAEARMDMKIVVTEKF